MVVQSPADTGPTVTRFNSSNGNPVLPKQQNSMETEIASKAKPEKISFPNDGHPKRAWNGVNISA